MEAQRERQARSLWLASEVVGGCLVGRERPTLRMMRVVGSRDPTEIELEPTRAHRRGLALDAMLKRAAPKRTRAVLRGTHAYFNRPDEARRALAARADEDRDRLSGKGRA